MWHEYRQFDARRLDETIRIIAHYFLTVARRVKLPLSYWKGQSNMRAQGFGSVTGICHYLCKFENDQDIGLIQAVCKDLPIMQELGESESRSG